MACSLPHEQLLRIWRGTIQGESGDIQLVAKEPNFVSGGLGHAGPWDYVQRVPMFWYGPGYIKPGVYRAPVTLADIPPTAGTLLDFDFQAPDGDALTQALHPPDGRPLPRLVVTLVWDATGRNVLDTWPNDWPNLKALLPAGAWFENATVGSSPSNTPPAHATIGTGAFPMHSGILDEFQRIGGRIEKPFQIGPNLLIRPTLADLYDLAMGNRPIVGAVATLSGHLAMMGHGSLWGGGDKDIAIAREQEGAATGGAEGVTWDLTSTMAPYYRLPSYVNQVPGWQQDIRKVDQFDGALDGMWFDNSITQLNLGFDTPARTYYQSRLIQEVMRREPFGKDDIPDLLYINYKAIDSVGHLFSINSPEMQQTLQVQDEVLPILIRLLNEEVGRGNWVMVLTADHGHQFSPAVSGAFLISITELEVGIRDTFDDPDGTDVIEQMRPTQIWVNADELEANGYTLVQLAQFLAGLTQAQTAIPGETIQPGHARDKVFSAVFPTSLLTKLPCLPEARAG